MNNTQIQTTFAPIIAFLAGLLAGKGVFGLDATTWATIIGGVAGLVATVWGAVASRSTAMVTTVANLPQVKQVTLDPASAGTAALHDATPDNVVVK